MSCENITPKSALGSFDIFERKNDMLTVYGWILDPKIKFDLVAVYIDKHKWGLAKRMEREDLAKAYPTIPHAINSGFLFSLPNEKFNGAISIRVVGIVQGAEIARIESDYVFSRDRSANLGKSRLVKSKRDWSQYGTNFISDIDLRDEMYQFLANHPLIKDPEAEYFASGKLMSNEIEIIFKDIKHNFNEVKSFLDFACGFGRYTRFLTQKLDKEMIVVSDIDKNAVDFCVKTFGVRGFYSVNDPSALVHKEKYDVIFVASLFSHLALPFWTAWFKQLYDMLNNGGLLIMSTHGDYCFDLLDANSKARSKKIKEGFIYLKQSETKRLPIDEYGTTYVNRNFVENFALQNDLEATVKFYPKGLWNFQDVYAIEKPRS